MPNAVVSPKRTTLENSMFSNSPVFYNNGKTGFRRMLPPSDEFEADTPISTKWLFAPCFNCGSHSTYVNKEYDGNYQVCLLCSRRVKL